jgi:hypothetical protein
VGTIDGISVSGAVDFGVAATFTIDSSTISEVTNSSGGNVTINRDAGTVITTNTGPNITINAPVATFTINSSESGALIQIFTAGTQTVLDSTTGSSLAYQHANETIDYVVQKAGFLPQRFTGKSLLGTESVTINLIEDPVYNSAHGLTYTTDASYNRSTKRLTVATQNMGDDIYSLLVDSFIAQSGLYNTEFPIQMNGPTSARFINDAQFFDTASINNWKRVGFQYLTALGTSAREDVAVFTLSSGVPGSALAEYQQADGSGTTDAINSGAIDQTVQIFGDINNGNFTSRDHLVVKYQTNGYEQVEVDIPLLYGTSDLGPIAYPIATPFSALNATVGDPAISITRVDHTGAPLVVGGKSFDYELQVTGLISGEDIIRDINYNNSLDATYLGVDPFNNPDMVFEAGDSYETQIGVIQGSGGTQSGFYVSRTGSDHPDFTRFQSNDGTYYVPPVILQGIVSNIATGSRVKVRNVTTATTTYNDIVSGTFTQNYTEGVEYSSGDVVDIYITQTSTTTAKLRWSATVVATASGWSTIASQEDDDVYNQYAIDGSTITKFSADYTDDEIDIVAAANFTGEELYAWAVWNETTLQGIDEFFGGFEALDAGNIEFKTSVNLFFDNNTTTNVWQTDNIRLFREDGVRPIKTPTTGGGGIDVNWREKVFIAETGISGVTPADIQDFKDAVFNEVVEPTETFREQMRLIRAEAAGKVAVTGNTVTFRDAADTKNRINANTDDSGQRTSITTDVS